MPSTAINNAYWFIFQNGNLLVLKEGDVSHPLTTSHISQIKSHLIRQHRLGQFNDHEVYSGELPAELPIPPELELITLRKALEALQPHWYTTTAKAFAIINWDKNHHYCGRCGAITNASATASATASTTTFERVCPACTLAFYPRISPSIIVLIRKGDQALLARGPHFLPGIYGLIAGFVESGESVEDAVHREVQEEVGIRIQNLNYFGSQAWPFPDSLMLAFTADYKSGEIVINQTEIEDAGWYRFDNIPGYPSSSISIARKLIYHFIEEQKQKSLQSTKGKQ